MAPLHLTPPPPPSGVSTLPTRQEADALVSLVTNSKPSFLMSLQLFSEMLRLFDNPDIHNFLFADEPLYLSYIANPDLKHSALACSINETKIDPTSVPQQSMSDRFGGDFFLSPVFTYNHVTFGFGVLNNVYYPSEAWNAPETAMGALGECRFVKNSKEGYMLTVAYYGTECTRLEYVKTISTTSQARCVIGAKLKNFRDATRGGSCNVDAVFPTVVLLQTSYEHRDCPFCNADHSHCKCKLQFSTALHPLDHTSFLTNALSELGNYYGVSHVTMYREGAGMCMGALGSRISITPSVEHDLVDRLRNMAINRHALTQDPMPSLSAQLEAPEQPLADQINLVDQIFDQSDQQQLSQQNSTNDLATDLACPLLSPDPDFDADIQQVIDISMLQTVRDSSSNTSAGMVQEISSNNVASFDASASPAQAPTVQQQGSQQVRNQSPQSPSSPERQSSTTPPTSCSNGKYTEKDQLRRLKAELRREKNRAAAQRSNMRKKILNDTLKSSLTTIREKVDLLRSKEMLLREENLRLRQQLGKD